MSNIVEERNIIYVAEIEEEIKNVISFFEEDFSKDIEVTAFEIVEFLKKFDPTNLKEITELIQTDFTAIYIVRGG